MADRRTVRELIEEGLSTTESLISQKDYTQAMICSRQTLEFLVRSLCRRNNISDSDPEQMVESLYLGGIISKEVCGEFFKIYKFGELAAVQGYNDTFSANESYRLLSQAVYAYQQMLQSQTMHRNGSPARRSARRKVSGGTLNQLPLYVKFGLPLVILLFLIFLVRSFAGHRKASEPVTTTEAVSSESSAAAELTTEAETTSAVAPSAITVYTTSSSLNVRETPSTGGKLLTTLPAGTVSGAPKIRAMKRIYELEQEKRGVYAGAIGYLSATGDMDFAIAIRTMILKNGRAYVQAGAGIVYDSIPANEYQETINKAKSMTKIGEMQ